MKPYFARKLLFLFIFYSGYSQSETIELNYDLIVPAEFTSVTASTIDFGVSGSRIELTSLTFDVTFSGNLWSPGETYEVAWLHDPLLSYNTRIQLVRNDTSSSVRVYDFTGIHSSSVLISDTGLAYFKIGVFGGDGAYFESLKITAEAIISPVPIPGGMFLFLSGLVFMRLAANCRK